MVCRNVRLLLVHRLKTQSLSSAAGRLVSANQCTEWAFNRLVPNQATVSYNDDSTEATVTCNAGYAFHSLNDADTELTSLTYTCTGVATEYTTSTLPFGSYVPQCVCKCICRHTSSLVTLQLPSNDAA